MISRRLATLPALAGLLVLGRWALQGTGNTWSKSAQHLYLPDPDLGWRRSAEDFVWLGLDAVIACVALAGAIVALGYLLRNRRPLGARAQGFAAVLLALPLTLPAYAFTSGLPAAGARETLPVKQSALMNDGLRASLPMMPAGTYAVIEHPDAAIAALLEAGGESFEARFAGGLSGWWRGDPADLRRPLSARISVRSDSIKTGISLRDTHALEDLKPEAFPTIDFELSKLVASAPTETDTTILISGTGELMLGDRRHEVLFQGKLSAIGPALQKKLDLHASPHLLLQASFTLPLDETIIGNDNSFDKNSIPISITLLLQHQESES